MKTFAISLITIAVFAVIYYWAKFEERTVSFPSFSEHLKKLTEFFRRKMSSISEIEFQNPKETKPQSSQDPNHFQSDFESIKKSEEKKDSLATELDFPEFPKIVDEILEKQSNKKRQFEKLIKLANKAKAVPKTVVLPNKNSKSKGRSVSVTVLSQQDRLQSKLICLENTIKMKRKVRILETIPESLLSKDSFSN